MAYTAQITYNVYDSNSSLFMELVREVLQAEFVKQRLTVALQFLPKTVKTDEYLLNPIADKEIDPAFCSIIKAKMEGTEQRFAEQQNDLNFYIIGVLADGLTNLRKITDAIYIILNDLSVKQYFFLYKNSLGENLISDSGKYMIKSLSTEYEVSKTNNDQNIVYGSMILQAEISEVAKFNTFEQLTEIGTDIKIGENEIKLTQLTEI